MKKVINVILLCILLIGMTGCNNKTEIAKKDNNNQEEKVIIEKQSVEWFRERYDSLVNTIFKILDWSYEPPVIVEENDVYVYYAISLHFAMTKRYFGGDIIPNKEFQDEVYYWFGIKDFMLENSYNSEKDGYEVPIKGRVGLIPSPQITDIEYDGNKVKMNVKIDYMDEESIESTRNCVFNIEYIDDNYFIKSIEEVY